MTAWLAGAVQVIAYARTLLARHDDAPTYDFPDRTPYDHTPPASAYDPGPVPEPIDGVPVTFTVNIEGRP